MFSFVLASSLFFADFADDVFRRPVVTYEERQAQRYFWLWPASVAFAGAAIGLGMFGAAWINRRNSAKDRQ
jgi:hypothetical protein